MQVIITSDYDNLSKQAAALVAHEMKLNPSIVLGLATGSTPEGMYKTLVDKVKNGELSFRWVTTYNLDEYLHLPIESDQSYNWYMHHHLFNHVDLVDERIHIPNGNANDIVDECVRYDQSIIDAGGIDLQVLGIGSNGHIGFNEPAKSLDVETHVVELTQETRQANARYFASIEEVPTHAVTMGVGSIMKSRQIMLLASGENKAEIVAKILDGDVDTHIPASLLRLHPNVTLILDEAAAKYVKHK